MLRLLAKADAAQYLARRKGVETAVDDAVCKIIEGVRNRGDSALVELAEQYDSLQGKPLEVERGTIDEALATASPEYLAALKTAAANIRRFAELQKPREWMEQIAPGVRAGQIVRPLERVGCYVPGGRYPLPSTLLMTVIPAQVAGVPEIIVVSPNPAEGTLAAAGHLNVQGFFRVGGAHAIAAMAFGTNTIPKVDRVVGPGNRYVASAKRLLAGQVAVDSVAGPSEVVIVANQGRADWVAADLLAQAEHDADACAILITTSHTFAERVQTELNAQLQRLSTAATARQSLDQNGAIFLVDSNSEAADLANQLAPEHLCLHDPNLVAQIQHAGSIFLGPLSAESFGDYATGPNHVLPTGGAARITGGLSVTHFLKVITVQEMQEEGARTLAAPVAALARVEGLEAHARAAEVRLC